MLSIQSIHHIAIITADYEKAKAFYTDILGFKIVREIYREQRRSYKCDLEVNGKYQIELFSFPDPPARPSRPEAAGLRHIAFEVEDIDAAVATLLKKNIIAEPVRIDETTGKRFTFIAGPDDLPIELYEK